MGATDLNLCAKLEKLPAIAWGLSAIRPTVTHFSRPELFSFINESIHLKFSSTVSLVGIDLQNKSLLSDTLNSMANKFAWP